MDNDGQNIENKDDSGTKVANTLMGGKEFKGAVEHRDPNLPKLHPAPEGIPEKFWDPVEGKMRTDDLLKSYSELEKKIGQGRSNDSSGDEDEPEDAAPPAEDDEEGSEKEADDDTSEDDSEDKEGDEKDDQEDADEAPLQAAIDAAQKSYAETGELSAEDRKPLHEAGISDEQIDLYLQGVKATEDALRTSAAEAAGSEENLNAAMQWAAENWSEKKILAYNAMTGDVETVGTAVAGLMADFRKANPGEGKLTNINSGISRGDVYGSMDEFQQDLAKADRVGDQVARRKALQKLRRSKQAGSVKSAPRTSPF